MDNRPISEQFRTVGDQWVDADAAANLLEELKSAHLAQWMLALGDMPVSRAEMQVKGSEQWQRYIERMCLARREANLLKVRKEELNMRAQEQNSAEATRRAEMKI
jgi:hypothetical protein